MEYLASKFAFFVFVLASVTGYNDAGETVSVEAAIETIRINNGDTFDCVDINSQPVLRHPLLQNHTIKMRPSSFPTGMKESSSTKGNTSEVDVSAIACPIGTIPIWRSCNGTNSLRFPSVRALRNGIAKEMHPVASSDTIIYEAMYGTLETNRGTRAVISVYEPVVNGENLYSYSAGLAGLYTKQTNTFDTNSTFEYISAGWAVYPGISCDNYARIFLFWNNNPDKNGCINLSCPGFVQVSRDIPLGIRIHPVSKYAGKQYEITVQLFKDNSTEDWWLTLGRQNKLIGYWPKELFNRLNKDETIAGWGGEVEGPLNEPSFPMGSGHFPQEGSGKVAYVAEAEIVNTNNELVTPNIGELGQSTRQPNCYDVGEVELSKGKSGVDFLFGGPGGCKG